MIKRFLCALRGHPIRSGGCACRRYRNLGYFRTLRNIPFDVDRPSWTRDERFGARWFRADIDGFGTTTRPDWSSGFLMEEGTL